MKWTALGLLAAVLTLGAPDAADACSCGWGPGICSGAATADAVFEATVDAVDTKFPYSERTNPDGSVTVSSGGSVNAIRTVRFSAIRALRGTAPDQLVRIGFGGCAFPFKSGVRYLIVLTRDASGQLEASSCGLTRPIEEATGLLEYIDSLSRQPAETLVWGDVMGITDLTRPPVVRTPLPGIQVILRGPITATTTTDRRGNFMIRGLPPGTYRATTSLPVPSGPSQGIYAHQFDLSGVGAPACAELPFSAPQQ